LIYKPDVSPNESRLRLRQHGTLFIFIIKNLHPVQIFYDKDRESSALPETISSVKTRDRLLHARIGRFAVFAHFVLFVVQTPTA
jgi:hypothetical protein